MRLYLIIISMLLPWSISACDICGCGTGSMYLGVLPEFNDKIVGVRYRYNQMNTHLSANQSTTYLTTKEKFHIAEFWGGWTIANKYRIMINLPLNYISKTNMQQEVYQKTGVGDISLHGFYNLFNKQNDQNNKLLIQQVWLGIGAKLPSGKYENSETGGSNTGNLFQNGTGSFDFLIQGMYDIRWQDLGVNLASNFKVNTVNQYDYYYGNKLATSLQFYYKLRPKSNISIAPNLGLSHEWSASDFDHDLSVHASGGYVMNAGFGTELIWSKWAMGFNVQTPVAQHLAGLQVHADHRIMIHLSRMW